MATKQRTKPSAGPKPKPDISGGLDLLDQLISKCYEGLEKQQKEAPKLGDFLKMIELRRKLTPHDESQKDLWQMLEKVRREVLESSENTLATDNAASDEPSHQPIKKVKS